MAVSEKAGDVLGGSLLQIHNSASSAAYVAGGPDLFQFLVEREAFDPLQKVIDGTPDPKAQNMRLEP
jgi:hypothetical protein